VLLLSWLMFVVDVYDEMVIVAVTVSTVVVPMSANATVPEYEAVAVAVLPVNTGVKVPLNVPFAVQALPGVIVAVTTLFVVFVRATDETANESVPPPVAVPVLVTVPAKAENVPSV